MIAEALKHMNSCYWYAIIRLNASEMGDVKIKVVNVATTCKLPFKVNLKSLVAMPQSRPNSTQVSEVQVCLREG